MSNWKETGLPAVITDETITVSLPDGRPKTVFKSDARYKNVLDAIREARWEEAVNLLDVSSTVSSQSGGRIAVKDSVALIDGKALPRSLSKRILAIVAEGLSTDALVKFWDSLQRNPSYRSVQQLHAFLEANNHPLTSDGCFIAYRKVRDDWKDLHSGTMDNSIGKVVEMPRNEVNEDPQVACSNGLHVANYKYATEFYGNGRLLSVKVNPADVVAVPVDYSGAKMRVCKFEVLQEIAEEKTAAIVEMPVTEVYSFVGVPDSPHPVYTLAYDSLVQACTGLEITVGDSGSPGTFVLTGLKTKIAKLSDLTWPKLEKASLTTDDYAGGFHPRDDMQDDEEDDDDEYEEEDYDY